MPLLPLNKDEWPKLPCNSPEHNPPSHMVITSPMKWVCPKCGSTVILYPTTIS